MKRKGHKPRDRWQRLIRPNYLAPPTTGLVKAQMEHYGVDEVEARRQLEADVDKCEYYINDLYQIEVRKTNIETFVHINVRRRDGGVVRDWRHLQRIKNEIVGAECEAIELYPAESRLVDTSNKFHLWACTDPSFRFPVGYTERSVENEDPEADTPGLRQRRLP